MKTKFTKAMAIMLAASAVTTSGMTASFASAAETEKAEPAIVQQVAIDHNEEINDYIESLQYDKAKLLASDVDEATGVDTKATFNMEDNNMIVTKKEAKKVTNKSADLVAINANTAGVYAGQLLIGDKNLTEGDPTEVICKDRAPISITVDLNGAGSWASKKIKNPTRANVKAAVDSILQRWGKSGNRIAANSIHKETMVSSEKQLEAAVGVKGAADKFNIDVNAITKGKKQVMVVSYQQVYFNVTAERGTNLFGPETTLKDVKKTVSDQTPPVMVNNVSYGRMIYVVLETNSSDIDVKEAFKASVKGVNINQNAKFKEILNNTSFTAYVFGGTADGAEKKIVKRNMDEIRDLIAAEAHYGGPKHSAAYPIGYSTKFAKDNTPATVRQSASYIETTYERIPATKVEMTQHGAYIVKNWFVKAQEITGIDENGKEILGKEKTFYQDTNACVHDNGSVTIPANYTNVKFGFDIKWGSDWPFNGLVTNKHAKNIKINVWGTTYNPGYSIHVDGNKVAGRR